MSDAARQNAYRYEPDYAVPPGETLLEIVKEKGMTQKELALRVGLSEKHVSQIINGKEPITQRTAIALERVTAVPAHFWNNREMIYRQRIARLEDSRRLDNELDILDEVPVKELLDRDCITERRDKTVQLEQVLEFFGVADARALRALWKERRAAARSSRAFESEPGATAAWLRLGELAAARIECRNYDERLFRKAIAQIRLLTVEPMLIFKPRMQELCSSAGVAVVFIPEIQGARLYGATWWATSNKAVVALNLRGKKDDQFWFSFFHEAGHVLHDGVREVCIDDDDRVDDPRERNADKFAAELLVPPQYMDQVKNLRSKAEVLRVAAELRVSPGIVVGRFQHETGKYRLFNDLKRTLDWISN